MKLSFINQKNITYKKQIYVMNNTKILEESSNISHVTYAINMKPMTIKSFKNNIVDF